MISLDFPWIFQEISYTLETYANLYQMFPNLGSSLSSKSEKKRTRLELQLQLLYPVR